jgi:hypothetical protein
VFINTIGAARQDKKRIEQLDDSSVVFIIDIYFGRISKEARNFT